LPDGKRCEEGCGSPDGERCGLTCGKRCGSPAASGVRRGWLACGERCEMVRHFKDLKVWQEASRLAKDIATKLVPLFPPEEKYRLGDQIIRSSRSVPSQIAEGFGKSSPREKHHYYEIAATSNDETENHLTEAWQNRYIDESIYKQYLNRIIRVRILISRLKRRVRGWLA